MMLRPYHDFLVLGHRDLRCSASVFLECGYVDPRNRLSLHGSLRTFGWRDGNLDQDMELDRLENKIQAVAHAMHQR